MKGEINMKKVFMKAGNRTLSKRLFSIMLIIGILFSAMPDATYADNSGRPPDAIEQEDTEDTESEMSDNKAAEPEQDTESDETAQDENSYQDTQTQNVQAEEDESNHDNEVMATSGGQTIYAILYETGELHFQYGNTVTKGVPNVKYQVASAYSDNSSVPWYRKSVLITKVTSDAISCSTGGIVSTAHWFNNCSKLTSLDLSKLDTSGVTNMSGMFSSCSKLTNLNLSKLNTSSVTNMSSMFDGCISLTSLDVSGFDTSKVTDMSYMFDQCYALTSLNVSKFNTSSVTNMSSMFSSCYALTSLDLSKFNTSSVTKMGSMFSYCSSLTSLNVSGFDTSNVTYTGFMFNNCSSLTSLDVSKFNTNRVTYTGFMFYGCSSLTSLDVSKFNTSMVTSMNSMFSYCSSLTNLNVSKFNTSNVTNMGDMFSYCSSLTSLDLSKFDTRNVTDMSYMFRNCSKLTSLDVSKFNTSKVTSMNLIFYNCSKLTNLNLSSFDTSKVTNMGSMFYGCSSITSLTIGPSTKLASNAKLLSQDWIQKSATKKVTTDDIYTFTASNHAKETFEKFVSYSISYNLNGGNISGNPSSYTQLDTFTLPTPTRNNYTFTGWTGTGLSSATKTVTVSKGSTGNRNYTANWTPTNYSISYNLNGGSISGQKTSYNIETANFTLPQPTRNGYTFTGWTGTGLSSATKSVTISKGSTGNRSYTANWSANGYTVSFNYNKPSTATGTMSGNGTTSKGVTYAAAYGNLPQPSIPGWTFNGWYTAANGGSGISATTTYTTTGNQTLYAHWTINTYSISYNTNGGSLSGQKTNYNVNTDSFTLPTPTKNGYTFTGWTGSNGTTAQKIVTIAKGSTGNKNYTANWTPTNYSISYNLNGGSISGQKTSYNIETANFTLPQPTRNGYTFTGWTGTGLSSATKSVTISKGSTGNRSYTANWSANGYTVSFNYNKPSTATGTMSGNGTTSKGVTYAAAYGNLPQPSIPGWTFNGWYTAANGGSGISATTTYTTTGNQTLYAHWTINTYSISYNTNGGSLSGQKTSYNVNTDSFTLPQPTRTGYTFTGWTGSNGTTAQKSITITKGSTGNKNYTANWSINSYYLDLNGWLSGSLSGGLGSHGTCDVYINNVLIADNCTDFYKQIPYGSKWEIKDIKATTGHYYNGVHSGSLTGTIGASNATVVLDFSAKKTTVTFYRNINSSDTTTAVQTFTYGVSGQSFSDKKWTKTGYTLLGWAETRNATAQKYSTLSPVVDGWINEKTPQASSNVTLYAVWSRNNYSISYTLNGGSISGQPTSYNVESANFTLPTPTRNGYTFTGWTGTGLSKLTKTVTVNKGSTGNRNYTANWSINTYTIGYTLNGGSISGQPTNYNVETATFALPTPSKSGYAFTGWTGTGLSGLTKTVTVSKGSTGNRSYTAHFEKTVNATFKYYNNQTVTVTGKITDSATSVIVKAPAASGIPSGYTFRGWSTSSAANASVNAAASASVTISANVTYYASYSKNVTATFYYCTLAADNYTYTNGAQGSVAASATQYLGYTGTVVNSNISIPSAVTASHGGASAQNYVGVSKDANSVSTVTPTTAYTKYYAVYTEPLKFYYYNGTTDTNTSVTRRMLSNGSTYSNSLSASAPAPAAYDGAAFAWWSCDSGVSGSPSLRKPLETGVNSLYAIYKKNVNISYNANGGSGAPAAQSGTKYYAKKENGSNITNPSITVTGSKPSRSGYNFSSWNTSANGNGTVYKAGTAYAVSANVTLYAQWQYNPVSVKVPQILTGDHAGTSQFRVKCDGLKAGNIKVTVPNSFLYKQAGKADITAAITAKSGNNIITPSNKVCVYNITTTNGLSAGCWQGSFNIGLTLTKE